MVLFKRVCKNGLNILRSRPLISILATLTAFLIVVGLWNLVGLSYMIDQGLNYAEQKLDFSIYLKEGSPAEDTRKLQAILENFPNIDRVVLVNKEQAFETFKRETVNNPVLGQAIQELKINPLTDYLVVKAKTPAAYKEVASYIEKSPYRPVIEFVTYAENQKVIERFISLSEKLKLAVMILTIALAVFGALVIFNATVLAIYAQREEIEVLRLMGASNLFIRAPFMVFALIITTLGFLAGTIFSLVLIHNLNPVLLTLLPEGDLAVYFRTHIWSLGLRAFAFVVMVNLISTWLSLRRYLQI